MRHKIIILTFCSLRLNIIKKIYNVELHKSIDAIDQVIKSLINS